MHVRGLNRRPAMDDASVCKAAILSASIRSTIKAALDATFDRRASITRLSASE